MNISSNLPFRFDHRNTDLLNAAAKPRAIPFLPASRAFSIHLALRGMDITRLPQQSPQIISHPTLVKQP